MASNTPNESTQILPCHSAEVNAPRFTFTFTSVADPDLLANEEILQLFSLFNFNLSPR